MEKLFVIPSREKDLGGFAMRRVLPYAKHRTVGPFLFFDHMGPAEFAPGEGMEVRPHPHIHLATVTYLFEGKIHHRDSLGSDQLIEPGAINWMTAGHGIVHSERAPEELKATGYRLNGVQCWVALPREQEGVAPDFTHYPAEALPEFTVGAARLKLLVGSAFGRTSPVRVYSDIVYLDGNLPQNESLEIPADARELGVYLLSGRARVNGQELLPHTMAAGGAGESLRLESPEASRFMILGGAPLGPRHMYWNFVSSSEDAIREAKRAWAAGPGSARFPKVPGDEHAFIPLPEEPGNPPGTIL